MVGSCCCAWHSCAAAAILGTFVQLQQAAADLGGSEQLRLLGALLQCRAEPWLKPSALISMFVEDTEQLCWRS